MACSPYPIAVRIGNVSLTNGHVARGMNLSIGEPPQNFAFMPSWPLNGTFLYGTDGHCIANTAGPGGWTDSGCTTFRGGAYNPLVSSSRTTANAYAFPADASPYPVVSQIADRIRFNENSTFDDFNMGIAQSDWQEEGNAPMMSVGLGTNSSLLHALKRSGQIASRSWSFFWGLAAAGSSQQIDGSFVMGGYDKAKVAGANYTLPLTTHDECSSQMIVEITDMVLNFANGTNASIFPNSSATMTACINPSLPTLMRLPLDPYYANWLDMIDDSIFDLGRSTGIYYFNMLLPSTANAYDGDLTITLGDGGKFSTRIAKRQITMPHTSINQDTGEIILNNTESDFVIYSLQNTQAKSLPQLGWQFFTSTYVMVNQDAGQFTLWEANPTTDEDLVAVDTDGAFITSFCTTATATATASATASSSGVASSKLAPVGNSVSKGLIAGVVVGCVAAVGIVAGFLIWYLARRRRQKLLKSQPSASASNMPIVTTHEADSTMAFKTELDAADPRYSSKKYNAYEMSADTPHYELPG